MQHVDSRSCGPFIPFRWGGQSLQITRRGVHRGWASIAMSAIGLGFKISKEGIPAFIEMISSHCYALLPSQQLSSGATKCYTNHHPVYLDQLCYALHQDNSHWALTTPTLPSSLQFYVLETTIPPPCKTVKSSRKSCLLLQFASKTSAEFPIQPCHSCKLQLLNHAWLLGMVHLPPVKQSNGNTDSLLSIHAQAGSVPLESWIWIKNSVFKPCEFKATPEPQTIIFYS